MGCCSGLCKILLMIWTIVAMLFSIAMIGFMAFKLESLPKQEKNPDFFHDLLVLLPGSGFYEKVTMINLTKYTWYAALGSAALMFIAGVIHVISTCRTSRCLLGLSTLLLVLTMAADITGIVLKYEAQDSILARLEMSLNDTIVNKYGNSDFQDVTDSWNQLGKNAGCCGINNGHDFNYANHWTGNIAASTPPCGDSVETGCAEKLANKFITYDDLWFTLLIGAKEVLTFLMLVHTLCVCKMGFESNYEKSRDAESYNLVLKKNAR